MHFEQDKMKKITILIGLCILFISFFIFMFRPDPPISIDASKEQTLAQNTQDQAVSSKDSAQQKQSEQTKDPSSLFAQKQKKLSAEAIRYYQTAAKYGWESIVRDFENGTIAKSKMTDKEKKKLCEIALSSTNLDQTKRLFAAHCKPLNGQSSFMIINARLKDHNGQIDQAAIIEKLRFFKAENVLQTETTYKFGPYEEKSNLQHQAIGWGLEDISDYLLSIGVDYHSTGSNLILAHLSGHHPTASMIQKLLNAGIEPNKNFFELMQQKDFSSKHPEIYQLLQKNIQ